MVITRGKWKNFNIEPENKNLSGLKNRTEMKNTLEGINRLVGTEAWISNLQNRLMEHIQPERQKRKPFFKMRIW